MIRTLFLAAALAACGPATRAPKEPPPSVAAEAPTSEAVSELAHIYAFSAARTGDESAAAEAARQGCLLKLDAEDIDAREDVVVRRVWIEPRCYGAFPPLRAVAQWEPSGAAGVRLLGGDPLTTIGEFSPVQDGAGVYLRGGAVSDGKVYEMRTPNP